MLNPESPALLCQLGEFSDAGFAIDTQNSNEMLKVLQERLLLQYPADHLVQILYSSGPPDYHSLSQEIPLGNLVGRSVPVYSNLWVPGVGGKE